MPPRSREIDEASVEMSRLMLVDAVALQEWEHEEPLDGKADYVFWGLEAPNAAAALGVPG